MLFVGLLGLFLVLCLAVHLWSKLSSKKWEDAWVERFVGRETRLVISEFPNGKTIRVELYCESQAEAEEIQEMFGGSVRELKEQNWAGLQGPSEKLIKIGQEVVVTQFAGEDGGEKLDALRREYSEREVISIPPQMAFGTGDHATTGQCLRYLVELAGRWKKAGRSWRMADLGCGSGILGIVGKRLGAESVWAVDFDPKAVEVAKANVLFNLEAAERKRVKVEEGDVLKASLWEGEEHGQYDALAANLFCDILEEALPYLVRHLKEDGVLILSGLLASQADECLEMAERAGLVVVDRKPASKEGKGKWVTAWLEKSGAE